MIRGGMMESTWRIPGAKQPEVMALALHAGGTESSWNASYLCSARQVDIS